MTESKIFLNTGKKVPNFEFKTKDTVVHRSSTDWNFFDCFYLSLSCKNESSGLLFNEVHTYIQNFTRVNKIEVIFFYDYARLFIHRLYLFTYVKFTGVSCLVPVFPVPIDQFTSVTYPRRTQANAQLRLDHVIRNALAAQNNEA